MIAGKAHWMTDAQSVAQMVQLAGLTRAGFRAGDVSTVMSPRTVLAWAENVRQFGDLDFAFETSFLNRCDEAERGIFVELYQRCFGREPRQGL